MDYAVLDGFVLVSFNPTPLRPPTSYIISFAGVGSMTAEKGAEKGGRGDLRGVGGQIDLD